MIFLVIILGLILFWVSLSIFQKPTIRNLDSNGTTIVAFGDSLVYGVGATHGNDFVSILSKRIGQSIINLGINGDTTASGLARIDIALEKYPRLVIILLGGNDYLQKIPPEQTFSNLELIIDKIHQSGSAVLLLGVRGGLLRDRYDARFRDIAKKHQTGFVSSVLDNLIGNDKFMSDTIHPNDAGYIKIADKVEPVLKKILD